MSINPTTSTTVNNPTGIMTKKPKPTTSTEAPPKATVGKVVANTTKTFRHKLRENLGVTVLTTLLVASVALTFSALDSTFTAMESNIGNLSYNIDRLDTRIDRLDTRIDRLDTRIDQLDTRIDRLEDKIDQRFEAQDAKLEEINLKLTALIAGLNATTGIEAAIEGTLLTPDS